MRLRTIVQRPTSRIALAVAAIGFALASWFAFRDPTIDIALTGTQRRPIVVVNGKVTQMPAGDYLAANTLVDTTGCSSTNVIAWNGSQFACAAAGGGGGGITNSAGANVIMMSNGTNAVASPIAYDGTAIVSWDKQTQLGTTAPSSSQEFLITRGTATDTAQLWAQSSSTNHVGSLGNNEMIQLVGRCGDSFDTSAQPGHCSVLDVIADGTISTGSGTLTNTAIAPNASCPGGGNCTAYAINVQFGTVRFDDKVTFNSSPDVVLGNHVENFAVVPQAPTTTTAQLDIGQAFSVDGYNLHMTNTATGTANAGEFLWANTSITASARGGLTVKQGTSSGGNNMGLMASSTGDPFASSVSLEWAMYSEQGPIVMGADATGFTSATRLTQNNHWVQDTSTGLPTLNAGCTSGTGSAIVGNDNKFEVTAGTTSTACTITFKKTWTIKPICNITTEGGIALPTYTVSATAITMTVNLNSGVYNVDCTGQPGAT